MVVHMDDVVVIGGGAAGLSAALVLGRARRSVIVVDSGQPRNAPAEGVHGFLSRDGLPPGELLAVGRGEVARYGGRFASGSVVGARPVEGGFEVALASGASVAGSRLLVATGLRDVLPEVSGLREGWGRWVLHCPYCHGHEVADEPLGVLGTHERSAHHALLVRQWSADVVYFAVRPPSPGEREELAARGVRVVDGPVTRVTEAGVESECGGFVPRRAVFVAPDFVPRDEVLADLGCSRGPDGFVAVDEWGATSVPGVYAAGNVVDPMAQVVSAAAAGSRAAVGINTAMVFT
jgi:thioredoxin reductase